MTEHGKIHCLSELERKRVFAEMMPILESYTKGEIQFALQQLTNKEMKRL